MERRTWSAPAMAPPQRQAADPADASGQSRPSQWGALEHVVSFVFYMLFFGFIAALLRSRFPIELGLFFFFTNGELIEWALRKVGIRLVPESLGASFISAFVWLAGASILLARWQGSAPAWLSSIVLPNPAWYQVAGVALGCAVLAVSSTAAVRKVLPQIGIEIAPGSLTWEMTRGLIGFAILGLLVLLGFVMASDWPAGH